MLFNTENLRNGAETVAKANHTAKSRRALKKSSCKYFGQQWE
jgi:hypothetical protein